MVAYIINTAMAGTAGVLVESNYKVERTTKCELEDLQKYVGGYIESYPEATPGAFKDIESIFVNEEGHPCCLDLPRNHAAEQFLLRLSAYYVDRVLVYGPMVIVCKKSQKSCRCVHDLISKIDICRLEETFL